MKNKEKGLINREWLLSVGFIKQPNFTITNSLLLDLGRNRFFSIGSISGPNEMMFLTEMNNENPKICENLIVIHNYDYDGYLTKERVKQLFFGITGKQIDNN